MDRIVDARAMVAGMEPELRPGLWAFVTLPPEAAPPEGALASFHEDEGLSLLLPVEEAARRGLAFEAALRLITLRVLSSVQGVGLTAAVSGALAARGIACNVVAAFHHDHLLVPEARAEEALSALRALQAEAG